MEKLHYITVATKPHIILSKIQDKVKQNNESITVLGLEENRYIGWNAQGNFGLKLNEVKKFVSNPEIKNSDIILFTDAYDVIYFGNEKKIIERFKELSFPIIFGAETECNPDPKQARNYSIRSEEFSYLNSGLYIGYVWAIRSCLYNYVYDDQHDDQLFWTKMFFNNKQLIKLDYKNILFLNTYNMSTDDFVYDGKSINYKNRTPLFLHVNGPDKNMLTSFL